MRSPCPPTHSRAVSRKAPSAKDRAVDLLALSAPHLVACPVVSPQRNCSWRLLAGETSAQGPQHKLVNGRNDIAQRSGRIDGVPVGQPAKQLPVRFDLFGGLFK